MMDGHFYRSDMGKLERAVSEFRRDMDTYMNQVIGVPFSKLPKDMQRSMLKRDRELHPSSFPYCGLRDGYERLKRRDDDPLIGQQFMDDWYLNIGTVAHSALQLWMGSGRKIFGNWKCCKCGNMHKVQIQPRKCKTCGAKRFDYHEIGGCYKRWVMWHSDGLFKDRSGRYWVIDYKTTTAYGVDDHRKTGTRYPYKSNRIQIETYCLLLEEKLGIKISGWMLVYVSRDSPTFKNEIVAERLTDERREVISHHLETAIKVFPLAMEAKSLEDFRPLIKNKLCPSRRYYDKKIADDLNACPLCDYCFDKDTLRPKLERTIKRWKKRVREKELA